MCVCVCPVCVPVCAQGDSELWSCRSEDEYAEFMETFSRELLALNISGPTFMAFIRRQGQENDYLQRVLQSRIASQKRDPEKHHKSDKTMSQCEGQHLEFCRRHHMRIAELEPAEETRKSPWFSMLTERKMQQIMILEQLHGEVVVDVSQNLGTFGRILAGEAKLGCLPTLLPKSEWWLSLAGQRDANDSGSRHACGQVSKKGE